MTDSLLIGAFVLFIVGSALSAAVTYRDCLAVKNVEGFMKWRQCFLVSSDAVQIGILSFGIASIIQNRFDRVELGITWALQCTACTNVTSLVAFFSSTNISVYSTSPSNFFRYLVVIYSIRGLDTIYCTKWRYLSPHVSMP